MVPVWSADLGGRYPEKTYYKNGVKHGSLVTDTGIFSFIKNLIKQDETIPLNSGIMSTYAY